jgi:cytochrome c biogenesis protein CcdA
MSELLLALFAGILTIAAPCTLPVLPILLGASIGQRASIRPALIAAGFVASFAFVALALNAIASFLHFDPDVVRDAGLTLLIIFGALMIWPAAFERLAAPLANLGLSLQGHATARTNLGGLVLGATLGLIWTPCAGPVLGTILSAVATSPDRAHAALLLLTYATGAALPMLGVAWRTGDLDAIAWRRTLRCTAAADVWRCCHCLRAKRVSAIRRSRARLARSIHSRKSLRSVTQGA